MMTQFWKKLLIVPPIALAVIAFLMLGQTSKPPQAGAKKEKPTPVKVITAKAATVVPQVRGYGRVQPARTWEAVAQVSGPVIWTDEKLRNGLLIPKGAPLLRVDDAEYRLTLAQADAQIAALATKDDTTRASLVIERRSLALFKTDLERQKTLRQKGNASQAGVDNAERAVLAARAKVQGLESSLTLNAAEREVLKRQRDLVDLNVARATLYAPFDLRLGPVAVSVGQYVNKGQRLFSGDGISTAEVVAQFSVGALRPLFVKRSRTPVASRYCRLRWRRVSEKAQG